MRDGSDLSHGDRVVDRDDQDPDVAVVVNLPGVAAAEWDVPQRDATVAEDNPGYADHAPVAVVVFEDELEEHRPDYEHDREIPLSYLEARHYSFPAARLEVVETAEEIRDDTPELREVPDTLAAVEERLAGAAEVEPAVDGEEVVLDVEKLGETYRVRPDGSVEGDGAVRDRLESAVDEVVG